jgi:thioredoxin-related protein
MSNRPLSVLSLIAFATTCVLVLGATAGAAGDPTYRDPFQHFFHQSFGDLKEELDTARSEGKSAIFVMFDDPDCPWCHKMKETILSRPDVQEYYREHFRPVQVSTRGDAPMYNFQGDETTGKDFAFKEHRVRATPVFMFFDLEGRPITKYIGPTRGVEEFLLLGEYVADGHYQSKKFTVFKQERLGASRNPS